MDALEQARAVVDDYLGEGQIAFPELPELLSLHAGVTEEIAVRLAQTALREYFESSRITIHLARAMDDDLSEVTRAEAISVIQDPTRYRYGDGDEIRAWFIVPNHPSAEAS